MNLVKGQVPLSDAQKAQLSAVLNASPLAPDLARTGEVNPMLRVFVVNFDGTNNNKDAVPTHQQPTLIADSFDRISKEASSVVVSKYYRGVGSPGSGLSRVREITMGSGCKDNAEHAFSDFVKQAALWQKENPEAKFHVHVTGFSRGSATALHFLNLIDDRGAVPSGSSFSGKPPNFLPGFVRTSAVLLDCVATGQDNILKLSVPKSCMALLHITADGEERSLFALQGLIVHDPSVELSIATQVGMINDPALGLPKYDDENSDGKNSLFYQRIMSVRLPGVHSDIGGSYRDGLIREFSRYLVTRFQYSLGLPTVVIKPPVEMIDSAFAHDSRYVKFGDREELNRQNAIRVVKDPKSDPWNGRHVIEYAFTGLKGSPPLPFMKEHGSGNFRKLTHAFGMLTKPQGTPSSTSLPFVGFAHKISIRLRRDDDPLDLSVSDENATGLVIEGLVQQGSADPTQRSSLAQLACDASTGYFRRHNGFLYLGDHRVAALPCLKKIEALLLKRACEQLNTDSLLSASAQEPLAVGVSIGVYRLGTMHNAGQVLRSKPLPMPSFPQLQVATGKPPAVKPSTAAGLIRALKTLPSSVLRRDPQKGPGFSRPG